jgi:thioredoxin-related protein
MLVFSTHKCAPCELLKKAIKQDDVQNALDSNDVKLVKFVFAEEEQDYAKQMGTGPYPTYFITTDEQIIKKNVGFSSSNELIQWINK